MGQRLVSAQFSGPFVGRASGAGPVMPEPALPATARMGEAAAAAGGGALGVETIRDEREGLGREATGSFPAVRWVTRWACDATCSVGFTCRTSLVNGKCMNSFGFGS
jgi:hypothetical protein